MKIYRVWAETFRPSYYGYWISIEDACKGLPANEDFRRVVGWWTTDVANSKFQDDKNGITGWGDYEHNEKLRSLVGVGSKGELNVSLPGMKILRSKFARTPAVMVVEPYVPEKSQSENLEPVLYDEPIGTAHYEEIQVEGS